METFSGVYSDPELDYSLGTPGAGWTAGTGNQFSDDDKVNFLTSVHQL